MNRQKQDRVGRSRYKQAIRDIRRQELEEEQTWVAGTCRYEQA
jgi:hypothetical protein